MDHNHFKLYSFDTFLAMSTVHAQIHGTMPSSLNSMLPLALVFAWLPSAIHALPTFDLNSVISSCPETTIVSSHVTTLGTAVTAGTFNLTACQAMASSSTYSRQPLLDAKRQFDHRAAHHRVSRVLSHHRQYQHSGYCHMHTKASPCYIYLLSRQ